MVRGLNIFSEYFKDFIDNYIIIGGTACDIIIEGAGLTPRVTKDIDIILVVEALSAAFVKHFWNFIQDGNYERTEKPPTISITSSGAYDLDAMHGVSTFNYKTEPKPTKCLL